MIDWSLSCAAVFRRKSNALRAVNDVDFVDIDDLVGMHKQKEQLLKNTQDFMDNKGANHVILWGSRGCGKSSLVKAVFTKFYRDGLRLIELRSDELEFCPCINLFVVFIISIKPQSIGMKGQKNLRLPLNNSWYHRRQHV